MLLELLHSPLLTKVFLMITLLCLFRVSFPLSLLRAPPWHYVCA